MALEIMKGRDEKGEKRGTLDAIGEESKRRYENDNKYQRKE